MSRVLQKIKKQCYFDYHSTLRLVTPFIWFTECGINKKRVSIVPLRPYKIYLKTQK